jgi:ubiquitin
LENTFKGSGFAQGADAKLVATPMDVISRLAKASAKKARQAQYDHEDIAKHSHIS